MPTVGRLIYICAYEARIIMKFLYTERITRRLDKLATEISNSNKQDYHDRLREFKRFCDNTSVLTNCIASLPHAIFDFHQHELGDILQWNNINWPEGEKGYAIRWNALSQIVNNEPSEFFVVANIRNTFTQVFFVPLYHYLLDQLNSVSTMLYMLLRYKRWAEWFEKQYLREIYETAGRDGEAVLDKSLRGFLFESGIDYPFSQPASPHGKVDIVAGLETDDPLVLEIKLWDSQRDYKENRLRDGLRQLIEYSTQYGKDKGYLVIFNLDQESLVFISEASKGEWPSYIEYGNRTYFFIDVHIAEKKKPISQLDKGKPVQVIEVELAKLLNSVLGG